MANANYVPSQAAIDRAKPFVIKSIQDRDIDMLSKFMIEGHFPIDYRIDGIVTTF